MNKSVPTGCCINHTLLSRSMLLFLLLFITGCVTEFIPEIEEEQELLVVEGIITDQPGINRIKLSKSLPLGQKSEARPVSGCIVEISDNLGNTYRLTEEEAGTYVTDPENFKGKPGRFYTLQIATDAGFNNRNYRSFQMEMKPVPPIDSLYYEKKLIRERVEHIEGIEECQIYLDTHDPEDNCKFYRWDFTETWRIRLPFDIPNHTCWITENSNSIFIETTATISENRLDRHPVNYISDATDRLKRLYSILVNQYSLNEDEYNYWKKVQKIIDEVGGLYDIIPASIPSNILCVENADEIVLGYFSVSAMASKRIYIKDHFEGIFNPYKDCITDTILGEEYIEGIGVTIWTLFDTPAAPFSSPRIRILTETRGCADCTVRGTTLKPDFWIEE
jgi:hypothetical protein